MNIIRALIFMSIAVLHESCVSQAEIPQNAILVSTPSISNDIVRLEGDIQFLEKAPTSVELNALTNDSIIFVFAEKQNHSIRHNLKVDLSEPGDYFPPNIPKEEETWNALNPGEIKKNTKVTSYYFHFDNATYNDSFSMKKYFGCEDQYKVEAVIEFNRPILGIIMRAGYGKQASLKKSDKILGLDNVDYCGHYLRHFPGINVADGCKSDRFQLSEDRKTLTITNHTDVHHDNYRVVLLAE